MNDVTRAMVEIRHVPGGTRTAYNEIYDAAGIRHPDALWRWLLDVVNARPGMRLLDVACGEGQLVRLAIERGVEAHGVDLSEVALAKARTDAHTALLALASAGGNGDAARSAAAVPALSPPPALPPSAPAGPSPALAARSPAPSPAPSPALVRPVFAVANGEDLPYPDGWFDRVSNMGSLEHYEDPVRGAAEMARVSKPGGKVVLHVPNTFGLRWNVLHAWRYGDVHDDGQPIQRYGTRAQWIRVLAEGGLVVERVLGYDEAATCPEGLAGWVGLARHPSRLLGPLTRFLPPDMASIFVFVCRRT